MIRYAILALFLLAGCAETIIEIEEPVKPEPYVVMEEEAVKETKSFTIKSTTDQFSPDVIEVDKDDVVTLIIVNTGEKSRFNIHDLDIEATYGTDETVFVEFVADKEGVFEFVDDFKSGSLIVK